MDLTVTDCKFHDNYKSKIDNEMICNNSAMPLLKPLLKLRQACVKTPNSFIWMQMFIHIIIAMHV